MVKSMEIDKLSEAFTKTGSIDLSNWDFPKYHLPEIEIPTVETIDPEDTIVGDIKKELQTQNSLVSQQVGILIEQNRLLTENYNKLKDMYDNQVVSYNEAEEDLRRSRNYNKWMMVVAIIAMLAAIASPIVTILVSK